MGQPEGSGDSCPTTGGSLIGSSNETKVSVEGFEENALLDTGSMISTIANSLVTKLGLVIQPVQEILAIEGVAGQRLEYLGYTECTVLFTDLGLEQDVLILVVEDTDYRQRVPLLFGTNVLQVLMENWGHKRPTSTSSALNMAFNCLTAHNRVMDKDQLGVVKTTKLITIPAGGRSIIHGLTHVTTCMRLAVLLDRSQDHPLPGSLKLSPSMSYITPGRKTHHVDLEVCNFSSKSVTIPAKTVLSDVCKVDVMASTEVAEQRTGIAQPANELHQDSSI